MIEDQYYIILGKDMPTQRMLIIRALKRYKIILLMIKPVHFMTGMTITNTLPMSQRVHLAPTYNLILN